MKRIFILLFACMALFSTATAQVDFRHITFDEAKTAAKTENKLIFVDFYTQWCGPCKMLAKKVFPAKEVGDYMNPRFVSLKLDAEAEGADLAKALKVTAYPTLAVFDADGNVIGRFEGYKDTEQFISAIQMATDPDLTPERIVARYEAGERNPKLVCAYADMQMGRLRSYEAAENIIDEYFQSLPDSEKMTPDNQIIYFQFIYNYDSPRAQYFLKNRDRFDADKTAAVAELTDNLYKSRAYRYMTTNEVNKSPEARTAYETFKKNVVADGMMEKLGKMIEIADNRASLNDTDFIAYCDKNFDSFSPEEQGYLMNGMKGLFTLDTPEQKKPVTDFMRRHISVLDAPSLMSAAYTLYDIEVGGH